MRVNFSYRAPLCRGPYDLGKWPGLSGTGQAASFSARATEFGRLRTLKQKGRLAGGDRRSSRESPGAADVGAISPSTTPRAATSAKPMFVAPGARRSRD